MAKYRFYIYIAIFCFLLGVYFSIRFGGTGVYNYGSRVSQVGRNISEFAADNRRLESTIKQLEELRASERQAYLRAKARVRDAENRIRELEAAQQIQREFIDAAERDYRELEKQNSDFGDIIRAVRKRPVPP